MLKCPEKSMLGPQVEACRRDVAGTDAWIVPALNRIKGKKLTDYFAQIA
jgi:hypothetical protein